MRGLGRLATQTAGLGGPLDLAQFAPDQLGASRKGVVVQRVTHYSSYDSASHREETTNHPCTFSRRYCSEGGTSAKTALRCHVTFGQLLCDVTKSSLEYTRSAERRSQLEAAYQFLGCGRTSQPGFTHQEGCIGRLMELLIFLDLRKKLTRFRKRCRHSLRIEADWMNI